MNHRFDFWLWFEFRHHLCTFRVYAPKSSESQVDVSVPVTFVASVDADSVDVLIVVSAVDVTDVPITITFFLFQRIDWSKN